jgi:hypothetical protein
MTRKFYNPAALALAALAAGAPLLLLGACKATDTGGNMSAATVAPKPGDGPSAPAAPQAAGAHADAPRRMGPAELQALVEGGNVVIYDTRSKMSYEQEHIKGALSMPHEEVAAREAEFPRDKTLVFYCT